MIFAKRNSLCLAYDNSFLCDGLGAQIQRIATIYGLTAKYDLNFTNNPIVDLDSNPGDGLRTILEKQKLIDKANSLLVDPLGTCGHKNHDILSPNFKFLITRWNLYKLFFKLNSLNNFKKKNKQILMNHELLNKKIRAKIFLAYADKITKNKKFKEWLSISNEYKIQLQVSAAIVSSEKTPERYIDHEKISDILRQIKYDFPDWKVLLHTDVDPKNKNWKITGSQAIQTMEYWKQIGAVDKTGVISLNFPNLEKIFPSTIIDRIESKISPIEVWKLMTTAKILILGKSSLSFIGGLLNQVPDSLIIAPKGYMNYPKSWLQIDYDKNRELIKLIKFRKWKNFKKIFHKRIS